MKIKLAEDGKTVISISEDGDGIEVAGGVPAVTETDRAARYMYNETDNYVYVEYGDPIPVPNPIPQPPADKMEQLEKENEELRARMAANEQAMADQTTAILEIYEAMGAV
jgi:hypothetical protein